MLVLQCILFLRMYIRNVQDFRGTLGVRRAVYCHFHYQYVRYSLNLNHQRYASSLKQFHLVVGCTTRLLAICLCAMTSSCGWINIGATRDNENILGCPENSCRGAGSAQYL